jgi:preprotein translocase subunit YajC
MSFFNFLLTSTEGGGTTPTTGFNPQTLITFGVIGVLFIGLYFVMIRPQKKQEKKDAEMRNALSVGDEVTTIGGIIGKVVSIKGETFVLETTKDKTKIRFLKGAIRSVDVKAQDIASAIATDAAKAEDAAVEAEAAAVEAPAEEKKPSKRASKKAKKQNAEVAPEATEAVAEQPAENTEA